MTVKKYFLPACGLWIIISIVDIPLITSYFDFTDKTLSPLPESLSGDSGAENEIRINLKHEYCDTNADLLFLQITTQKMFTKLNILHCF